VSLAALILQAVERVADQRIATAKRKSASSERTLNDAILNPGYSRPHWSAASDDAKRKSASAALACQAAGYREQITAPRPDEALSPPP
jgi:hypothetical protein